jgi:site-specific DNA-methyltransferase (adenine-specific)
MILYSSNPGDLVCDFFLGSFSTAKVALGLGRECCGFEINKNAFDYQMEQLKKIKKGELLSKLRTVPENRFKRKIVDLSDPELSEIKNLCFKMLAEGFKKKDIIKKISERYRLGTWSVLNLINSFEVNKPTLF